LGASANLGNFVTRKKGKWTYNSTGLIQGFLLSSCLKDIIYTVYCMCHVKFTVSADNIYCTFLLFIENNHFKSWQSIYYLRNRKHVLCFYQVIETQAKVWENEKCCG